MGLVVEVAAKQLGALLLGHAGAGLERQVRQVQAGRHMAVLSGPEQEAADAMAAVERNREAPLVERCLGQVTRFDPVLVEPGE